MTAISLAPRHRPGGTFYEGVMTSGYPSAATENAVQANIVAAGYAPSSGGGTTGPIVSGLNSSKCADNNNGSGANGNLARSIPRMARRLITCGFTRRGRRSAAPPAMPYPKSA
jgi:hypothetical protein